MFKLFLFKKEMKKINLVPSDPHKFILLENVKSLKRINGANVQIPQIRK